MSASTVLGVLLALANAPSQNSAQIATTTDYAKWHNGPPADPNFFPIAVWLQAPRNAKRFQEAGMNVYVGLYRGPTEQQLTELKAAGMGVICSQNKVGLGSKNADIIIGWMHGDEPDNAQRRRNRKGYGPPILPSKIVENYQRLRERDPSRPILLNLGQGVAYDNYIGRGVRRNHPEDYPEYIKGCDIASFDIYPAVHRNEEVAGKLEFVPFGVERLRRWSDDKKIVWNVIECSRIHNTKVKPTPQQIRAEVWMSLIHGSRGLIYFVHQFQPRFIEASLLEDPELLPAVTAINRQIHELAPVLNSPTIDDCVQVASSDAEAPIATMCKKHEGATYVFAVCMRDRRATAALALRDAQAAGKVEVLGEDRTIEMRDGQFHDAFDPYAVHLYRIPNKE